MDKKFIKTKDKETADKLLSCKFELIYNANGMWVFLNKTNISVAFDNKKIVYSNMLTF